MDPATAHNGRVQSLASEMRSAQQRGQAIALRKSTSNLFRRRDQRATRKLDVRRFRHVLEIDPAQRVARVEGMTTYETLVDATLAHRLLPAVVPQLKTITVGGAVSGLGIESSSFRFGLVHDSVNRMEVLLSGGDVIECSRDEHAELFYALPNSYGTLGYIVSLEMELVPSRPYVRLTHTPYVRPEDLFAEIPRAGADFLDGTAFDIDDLYLTTGKMTDEAPSVSDYTWLQMYYRSIRERRTDYLKIRDYIWRWDTDWFWCSKQFGLQNRTLRFCATPWLLNSRTYQHLMRLARRVVPDKAGTESVIQDVDIPLAAAGDFYHFLMQEIDIRPIWICPFRVFETWPLYALEPGVYINFGFWDVIATTHERGHFNRKIEARTLELGGKKALYSSAWYDRETFERTYGGPCYTRLKNRYDPDGLLPDLYTKCVQCR
jgi:FAD/FMN-containing dehydrogenase